MKRELPPITEPVSKEEVINIFLRELYSIKDSMDDETMQRMFDEAGITALLLTTQVGVQFLLNYPNMKTLRMLVMGGEKLPAVDPSSLSYTIVNGYGPTENCCGVSLFPITGSRPAQQENTACPARRSAAAT